MNTNSNDQKQRLASAGDLNCKAKKPYVKPEVRHERIFETQALTCGKVQTTQMSCGINRKTS